MNIKDFFILITLVLIIACLGTFFVGTRYTQDTKKQKQK